MTKLILTSLMLVCSLWVCGQTNDRTVHEVIDSNGRHYFEGWIDPNLGEGVVPNNYSRTYNSCFKKGTVYLRSQQADHDKIAVLEKQVAYLVRRTNEMQRQIDSLIGDSKRGQEPVPDNGKPLTTTFIGASAVEVKPHPVPGGFIRYLKPTAPPDTVHRGRGK